MTFFKSSHRIRIFLGVGLLVLLVLISTADFALHWKRHRGWQDMAGTNLPLAMEERLSGLKAVLPPRGVVGYVSNVEPWGYWEARCVLTQYVLAPVVVERGAERELVIGNFEGRPDLGEILREYRLTIVRDFGNGIMLFRKKGR